MVWRQICPLSVTEIRISCLICFQGLSQSHRLQTTSKLGGENDDNDELDGDNDDNDELDGKNDDNDELDGKNDDNDEMDGKNDDTDELDR